LVALGVGGSQAQAGRAWCDLVSASSHRRCLLTQALSTERSALTALAAPAHRLSQPCASTSWRRASD
jgi:phosphoheptose isomerase